MFVLVGFCGIRTEEASRLKWTNIKLSDRIVEVPAEIAKKAQFRNNPIPQNAVEWLRVVEDKRRTGPIIGSNWRMGAPPPKQLGALIEQSMSVPPALGRRQRFTFRKMTRSGPKFRWLQLKRAGLEILVIHQD